MGDQIKHNQLVSVEKNIKTLFFVRQGPSKINFTLQKDTFYANEKAVIQCEVDNSRCDKDIKEIKIKLRRNITCSASSDNKRFEDSLIMFTNTFSGVRHG